MKKNKIENYIWAYLMIGPLVIGLGIFYIIPFFQNFYFSLTNLGAFGNYEFIGMDNYEKLIKDPKMYKALKNTFMYVLFSVPFGISISIIIAVMLNSKIKGVTFYRVLYFLPAVTMPTAIAMVWKWLYNKEFGLLNQILLKFGIEGQSWLTNSNIALYAVIIVAIWASIGYNMVILLAGLQGIPKMYYEAAEIDGAGPIKMFFKITLPLLSPTIFFVSVMTFISSFQMFDLVFMMIGKNNPAFENTMTIVYYFYNNAFQLSEKGYGAAIAVVLFIIIFIFTMIQLKLQKKLVNY
ncbi:multiple sugar transport system permease protein [Cetobacterium ceti]|uniref:Multiple sugar transport system permease protein n=1 Tax=Cetobacterium ceti TaxID=180163 RepID=A0A1T4M8Y6_9FUSO|nr:sugar ABC transporter permease [Cetobacterium ceti]SJZ63500.1 multiple sugar transport system permease protein [Cetobacterium ceti]